MLIKLQMRKIKEGKNINQYEAVDPNIGAPSLYLHKKLSAPNTVYVTISSEESKAE